jgi:hypothetical protein
MMMNDKEHEIFNLRFQIKKLLFILILFNIENENIIRSNIKIHR